MKDCETQTIPIQLHPTPPPLTTNQTQQTSPPSLPTPPQTDESIINYESDHNPHLPNPIPEVIRAGQRSLSVSKYGISCSSNVEKTSVHSYNSGKMVHKHNIDI